MADVIRLDRFFDNQQRKPKEEGIVSRRGSPNLYVDFAYLDERVYLSTGIPDTPKNREKVGRWMKTVLAERDGGTLRFAEAFPKAPAEMRGRFSRLEGRNGAWSPDTLTFGVYAARWKAEVLAADPSELKQYDYERVLNSSLLPYFGEMTFREIHGLEVKKFFLGLRLKRGKRKGEPVSRSRVNNILAVFRSIWYDAKAEMGWDLPDPFDHLRLPNVRKMLPRKRRAAPEVFRFEEWSSLIEAIDPYYRPVTEFMVLTGMIASEVGGLRRQDVGEDRITVCNSVVRGVEKTSLKTDYRARTIPITVSIRRQLDAVWNRWDRDYPFRMRSGIRFDGDDFRKNAWARAFKVSGIPYRRVYTLRHTFAAWSLIAGVHPERLVYLMGHASKTMIYETYGKYREGLETDGGKIREYFGSDFSSL